VQHSIGSRSVVVVVVVLATGIKRSIRSALDHSSSSCFDPNRSVAVVSAPQPESQRSIRSALDPDRRHHPSNPNRSITVIVLQSESTCRHRQRHATGIEAEHSICSRSRSSSSSFETKSICRRHCHHATRIQRSIRSTLDPDCGHHPSNPNQSIVVVIIVL
jgi:hypothetical protein